MSPPAVPYVATVTASAEVPGSPAWGALVHDDPKRWCTPNGPGATLTVTFDRPVAIGEVWLETGSDRDKDTDVEELELITDKKTFQGRIPNGESHKEIKLDGAPTKTLTLKIGTILPTTTDTTRTCLEEMSIRDPERSPVPMVLAPPAAAAALPGFMSGLDAALDGCDAKAIAAAFAFPLAVTMHFDVRPADRKPKRNAAMKFGSAAQLASACANDGRMIGLGFLAGRTADLSTLASPGPGLVRLGDPELGWRAAWKTGWKITALDLHDSTFRSDGWGDEPGPVEMWIDKLNGGNAPSMLETAADALFVGLDAKSVALTRAQFIAAVGTLEDPPIERVTTARSGGAGWMVLDTGGRVSVLTDTVGDKDAVIAAFVSSPRGARDKAAAMAPLPPLTRDTTLVAHPDVLAAVSKLLTGPLDKVAASRPDLIAIGVTGKDAIIGGDKLAPVWRSRWANQLTITGVIGRVASGAKTALVVVDATKGKALYRIALVLDRTSSGAWSLAHLHIATP